MAASSEPDRRKLVMTLARNLLPSDRLPNGEDVSRAVETARQAVEVMHGAFEVDTRTLARELESQVAVFVGGSTSLSDDSDHVEWLSARRHEIEWRFWDRYRRWLGDVRNMPPQAIQSMDEITDDVLRRLEDPGRPGAWDRRGMVVGQVQSGKTGNYSGLICKAADAGYKFVVVLAGLHNSLRSQTQLRLDEAFLGFDTQQARMYDRTNRRIGVGRLPGTAVLPANSMTNSEERGDFSIRVARQVGIRIGSDPILLVVKKNKSILQNLIEWVTSLHQERHPETGQLLVPGIPLLVIDDEADNASVNTKERPNETPRDENGNPEEEYDPTAINGLIRKLLNSFEKSAYVGYTATPFANIFIYEGEDRQPYGPDLFPRSFINRLPEPSNYVGPAQVFGVRADAVAGLEARPGLPIVRPIEDSELWIATGHKKSDPPAPRIPRSLHKAIRSFVLACAARRARGQTEVHNSMLVHVTRFVDVQEIVERQVAAEVVRLRDRLRYGDGSSTPTLRDELRELWEEDFEPTTHEFDDPDLTPLAFDDIEAHLEPAAGRIETLRINGSSRDALAYYDHPKGFSVIAIGGDKLSRGLTLEGLSVSYYLRASKMYDTLMQMGRWFGYRPGYTDMCRLYTTPELVSWYEDITVANEELLVLFDEMAAVGGTPRDFGLRVRHHPDGLLITAPAKMRNGKSMKLSFSDTTIETISFQRDAAVQRENLERTSAFVTRISDRVRPSTKPPEDTGNVLFDDVHGEDVAGFLEAFTTHPGARKANARLLAAYIRSRLADQRLTTWTVALCGPQKRARGDVSLGEMRVNLTLRSLKVEPPPPDNTYVIRRIVSPTDETLDLTEQQLLKARTETLALRGRKHEGAELETVVPSGPAIRRTRDAKRGLLLLYALDPDGANHEKAPRAINLVNDLAAVIGFAVSFPADEDAPGIDYKVNNQYWQMELGIE